MSKNTVKEKIHIYWWRLLLIIFLEDAVHKKQTNPEHVVKSKLRWQAVVTKKHHSICMSGNGI